LGRAARHIVEAIACEKALTRWRRTWKIEMVEAANPSWSDLYPGLLK
jgi:putative endonuclease